MDSIKHHELKAEWVDDEHGPAVMLTQADDGYCEPQTVLVHPWQLRATCEHFGILPTGDEQTRRAVSTLTRRLLVLADRIGELRSYVATYSDHEHADLHVEMVMLNALGDLASEWAQEVGDLQASAGTSKVLQDAPEAPQGAGNEAAKGAAAPDRAGRPKGQPPLL